ncbi:family 78 glycoside hydrolase catalytic domain [Crateriforma spongiae]|uniref:family 78 glycoside hydrolase catalytic domain n=1 Tax=Crateriforma spongiae TaxID=2724528 RepID=UPI001F47864A|nr:family 78 glycoside hydrolase catalytic domain [Crateriforma spongiae]
MKNFRPVFLSALFLWAGSAPSFSAGLQPHSLTVGEGFADPIGFYDPSPVFSWKLPADSGVTSQSAYQIIVTDVPQTRATPLWDSGKIVSDQSTWVPYSGPALKSRQQIVWRVRFWDDQGRRSQWSNDATIEMGLLSNSDWKADWIEVEGETAAADEITILKAEYGSREGTSAQVVDVTARLSRAIDRGVIPFPVTNARLGGDPAPDTAKTLWVEFQFNGVTKKATVAENKRFSPLPPWTAHPGYYFRHKFDVRAPITKARLYGSALGICEFHINGQRVGDDVLSPGYTAYSKRVESLAYDVTDMIHEGDNAIGALLGEGWYAGRLLLSKPTELRELNPKLIGQLELTFADGTVETITTDDTWRGTDQGPIRAGGFYHGEDYDATQELGNWNRPDYDDSAWKPTKSTKLDKQRLIVPKRMPPVQCMKQVAATQLTEPEPGRYVFDFGQNLVGVPDINIPVMKGEKVQIRFAEMLQQDGSLYTENYRSARSQATFQAAKDGTIHYQPSLSFFGFRYVELSGLSAGAKLTKDAVVAKVLHTAFHSSGEFASSHDKLNQLQSNIRWGQISNFVDIPTDCPQRDERLGWTGDAQVFLPTSFFNYDVYSFWARWLQSVRDEQNADGEIPHTVPAGGFGYASPGWADVIVTAPWQIYVRTGDPSILHDNYAAMQRWVSVYENRSKNLIPNLKGWGDWLQPYTESDRKGDTAQDLIATAYFGRDARILSWAAEAIGKEDDAARYENLHASIRTAFTNRYFPENEIHVGADTQTACLMGLGYDLIEADQRDRVAGILMTKFKEADRHLRTGFLGTPLLAPVFDELGHPEICYELLFKESYPSWFYSINQGATTMWERWNSYSHADGFGDASMNSFNHYAYGAIGQFLYERVAGLSPDPERPGYKHFFVRPLVDGPLDSASAELETPYGTAKSQWRRSDDGIIVEAVVPPNATATAELPADGAVDIQHNGQTVEKTTTDADMILVTLQPGTHRLAIKTSHDSQPDQIVPPKGGQPAMSFAPQTKLEFASQNVTAEAGWAEATQMPFSDLYRVECDERFTTPSDVKLCIPIDETIQTGDVVLVSYWICRPKAGGQPNNVYLSIGDPSGNGVYQNKLSAYREWKQHVRSFVATETIDASTDVVRFDLGEAGTVVELADFQLVNYGSDYDIESLPRSTVMYAGREEDAAWRINAWERIEKIRKGDLEIEVVDAQGQPVPNANVHVAMQKHAFGFGNAVNAEMLGAPQSDFPITPKKKIPVSWNDAQKYREIVKQYFDRVTFESELRPHNWQNLSSDNPVWQRRKDILLNRTLPWLLENNIAARGHYIGWAPMDFNAFEKQFIGKPDEHRKWLWGHMADVLPATSQYVKEWDTINHIIGWGQHTYEKEYGSPKIYADIMAEARRLAPNASHAINEGKVLPDGYKREPYKKIIRYLNEQNQGPDMVGFMGHFGLTSLTPPEELLRVYDEFGTIAPRLQLSEFDVDAGDDDELQADYFRDVMIASFSHPNFEAICQWGFWEPLHWKPAAALWRKDWTLKPAGKVFVDLVAKQWWTDETLVTPDDGTCKTRGFLGTYQITVTSEGMTAEQTASLERSGTTLRIRLGQ